MTTISMHTASVPAFAKAHAEASKFSTDVYLALRLAPAMLLFVKQGEFVLSAPAETFEGSEGREISIPRRTGEPMKFDGSAYLRHFALPNFYFDATTTYALLRHAGVPLGKNDFLGG